MKQTFLQVTLLFMVHLVIGQIRPVSIDTTVVTNIGGISQVIKIKGKDASKPILLYLHGAGGSNYSLIANADKVSAKLQEHFVVALWDQREYGKTAEINPSPLPLTISLIVKDTKEVIDYLLHNFHRKKLYMVGHSMGSVEAAYIADLHPDLLHAIVQISPAVNGIESQKIALTTLKVHFKKINNRRAVEELNTIKLPARDFESLFIKYIWQTEYEGEHITDTVREKIKPLMKEWMATSASSLSNEVFELNFFKQFPEIKCPVYFFVGRKDFTTNARLSEKYYKKVRAIKKQLFWFEKSGHGIPDTEPELMQNLIIEKVLLGD